MPEPDAVYAYAFLDGRRPPPLGDAGGRPLSIHRRGGLAAVIRGADSGEFCGPQAEANLRDPAWVTPRACEHAAVLERVMRLTPIFPLGFATLFAGFAGLDLVMDRHRAAIGAFLRHVEGKEEWGLEVTACLDHRELLEALAVAEWPELRLLPAGTRYLRLRQAQREVMALARRRAVQMMDGLVDVVRPIAEVKDRSQPAIEDAEAGDRIGDWALLVERADREVLRQLFNQLEMRAADCELRLRLCGPWPPFSFRPNLGAGAAEICG